MTPRVLLIQMPFGSVRWPSPAIGLLKAICRNEGIACDARYFTFDLAERIGLETYNWIAESFGFVLGGERLFAKHYFTDTESALKLGDDDAYHREVLSASDPLLTDADRAAFEAVGRHVPPFLDDCFEAVEWSAYDVVGFSVSFQQVMPSLGLARRLREAGSEVRIVFGGAACDGPMGIELLRQFPEIDHVFLGEADRTFPQFVHEAVEGARSSFAPGVVSRGDIALGAGSGDHIKTGGAKPPVPPPDTTVGRSPTGITSDFIPNEWSACVVAVEDLDRLPTPDYDDFFDRLRRSALADQIEPLLLFETSRGCWWGASSHCKFCGLNGSRIRYRTKRPERVLEEITELVLRHGARRACTTDNILDPSYFRTLLPRLRDAGLGLRFEQELRTPMTKDQIRSLAAAGLGAAQLGVESLSTPILRAIDKGTTALDNLQTLKWLTEMGVTVHWNFLFGFPEERPQDYDGLPELIRSIVHWTPPIAWGPVRLDRFSPYFDRGAELGIRNVRPKAAFRHVYPFDAASIARLAYYFDFDFADARDVAAYTAPVLAAIEDWVVCHPTATLRSFDRPDGVLLLTDTRPRASNFQYRLSGWRRELYLFCDEGRTHEAIRHRFAETVAPSAADIDRVLQEWLDARLLCQVDRHHIALALRTGE